MGHTATTDGSNPELPELICMNCTKARFPEPQEQCYKFGGLICTVDNSNVEKYQSCKFPPGVGQMRR
ncbi:MAG TPA: hypothetical protein ENF16_03280 [Bacteroidetes bacterium]|nr:hypothetical protein [Bacteroidota bacterium]